jgi:hypothetical protein
MDLTKLNDAITQYYKLKESYENKINQNKLKIINNPVLTNKEKQQKFKLLKKFCINCKKEGGTIFSNNDGILKARCGHLSSPCSLNIEIDKGKYILGDTLAEKLKIKINKLKVDIIKIKLDFLFSYISESEALEKFNALKESLTNENSLYQKVELHNINIMDNPKTEDLLKEANKDLFIEIQQIKDYCKVYNITKNKLLLENVVQNYLSKILPLTNTISDLKYEYREIDKNEDPDAILIEKKYTLESLLYTLEQGKIINNKK